MRRSAQTVGFTLVEMMVVIAIIGLLLAVGAPGLSRAIQANRLTAAGEGLLFRVSLAQQLAVTESRPVEMRFYSYPVDGTTGVQATQMFFLNQSGGVATPVEAPAYLGEGSVVIPAGSLSPLLGALSGGAMNAATDEPFKTKSAQYQSLVFYPNGSTSINLPLRSSYVTLVSAGDQAGAGAAAPANYYTLQIDPVTGRGRSYRP